MALATSSFKQDLPHFSQINPEEIEANIKQILENNKQRLHALLSQEKPFTWENLMQPLEDMGDELHKAWSPIQHLHGTKETPELRDAYNKTLPLLTAYYTEISQNEKLFQAISDLATRDEFSKLNPAQRKIIENDLRDFKLSGIHLAADKKTRFAELQQELSQQMTKFSENVLDATNAYTLHITDENQLKGLPAQAKQLAIDNAKQRKLDGFVFTLDYPSYSTAILFLENRELRKKLHEAYTTRASDQGPHAGKWDNAPIMENILNIREEIARLVGFDTYANYSLATKMAKEPTEVLDFLNSLLVKSKPIAEDEYQAVIAFAKQQDDIDKLEAWDMGYYSEKLQQSTFNFSQEDLRPYFPIDKALHGLFSIVNKLYGIRVEEEKNIDVWHPHVRFFSLYDQQNNLRAGFYVDLYARTHKRDGAWMDECVARRQLSNGSLQLPVAYLTCNFMQPVENKPALLTHDDVITLFHEFGHCLHHMLTKVNYRSVSGINGVAWDAVEFPSQFMENYCWEKETLKLMSGHYQTNEPIPQTLFDNMLAAKHFHTGLQMLRQLEFALFDFRLHLEYESNQPHQIQSKLDEVRKSTAVMPVPTYNRFQNSFSHIFAGGYSAGYYSYKWAEVLSSDAYAKFEENGLLDPATGKSFMENILEVGGVREPMESFIAFRGRKPTVDALLRHSGIE